MTATLWAAVEQAVRDDDRDAFERAMASIPDAQLRTPLGSLNGTVVHLLILAQRDPSWAAGPIGRDPGLAQQPDQREASPVLACLASGVDAPAPWLNALLGWGATVQGASNRGETPLHWAATRRDGLPLLERLLAEGAPVDALDKGGRTPLYHAVSCHDELPVVQALLDAGADPRAGWAPYIPLDMAQRRSPDGAFPLLQAQVIRNEQSLLRSTLDDAASVASEPGRRRL